MNNKNDLLRQITNVVVFVFTLVVNFLAIALPLNNRSTSQISDELPSFFTPAGFTFSVWSVIYLALIGFVIYQAMPSQRENIYLRRIGYLPAVANLLNGLWIFAWHYAYYGLSVLIMLALLGTLLTIYIRLNIGLPSEPDEARSNADLLLIYFPMAIYFAWINVATVANIASVANYAGWNGFGIAEPTWSVIMIGVVTLIAGSVLVSRANAAYAGVLIWALYGISAKQPDMVATAAIVAAVVIAIAAAVGWYRFYQRFKKPNSAATTIAS